MGTFQLFWFCHSSQTFNALIEIYIYVIQNMFNIHNEINLNLYRRYIYIICKYICDS